MGFFRLKVLHLFRKIERCGVAGLCAVLFCVYNWLFTKSVLWTATDVKERFRNYVGSAIQGIREGVPVKHLKCLWVSNSVDWERASLRSCQFWNEVQEHCWPLKFWQMCCHLCWMKYLTMVACPVWWMEKTIIASRFLIPFICGIVAKNTRNAKIWEMSRFPSFLVELDLEVREQYWIGRKML